MYSSIVCVGCRAGCETQVAEAIELKFDARALFPTYERDERKNGIWQKKTYPMLNGYVFVYAEKDIDLSLIGRIDNVNRVLRYDEGEHDLRGGDREFALWIMKYNGCIGVSRAFREGDVTRIAQGPLKEYEGMIKKIDRRHKSALLEITVGDTIKHLWLSFEWMEEDEVTITEERK